MFVCVLSSHCTLTNCVLCDVCGLVYNLHVLEGIHMYMHVYTFVSLWYVCACLQDMLDLEEGSGTFEGCFFTFRSKVKVLEMQAAQLLCELWDNSDTMFSKLRVLELFNGLCSRESIQVSETLRECMCACILTHCPYTHTSCYQWPQVKLAERCKNLLGDLNEDMVQNQAVLQCFSENPPLLKDIPPTASALFWLQGFKQRVKITLDRLQPLIPDLLASDDGWKLRDMQKKLLSQVER